MHHVSLLQGKHEDVRVLCLGDLFICRRAVEKDHNSVVNKGLLFIYLSEEDFFSPQGYQGEPGPQGSRGRKGEKVRSFYANN